jgi:hypothetical protein
LSSVVKALAVLIDRAKIGFGVRVTAFPTICFANLAAKLPHVSEEVVIAGGLATIARTIAKVV